MYRYARLLSAVVAAIVAAAFVADLGPPW